MNYRDPLRNIFGFTSFRPGQEDVVRRLLEGLPVLAVFPTGAGKSLCYQLPALLLDGLTLVVSPLIALMKDQVDFLQSKDIAAARLDSSLDARGAQQVLNDLTAGKLKILYIAPERLANERFLQTLRRLTISLLAIDEAHCISEWGHNFRPDYLKLARLAKNLNIRRVLCLTATATPAVAQDICREFGVTNNDVINTGFYRPNLNLHITPCRAAEKPQLLLDRLGARPRGATIVYVTLQKTAQQVAAAISSAGFAARPYHAGMKADDREATQNWFMSEPAPIVVATIAFGMGIDKANIRAVYHYNLPKSLENYSQEIGRAGRDGQPSDCELFACADDCRVLENFIYGDTPARETVAVILNAVMQCPPEFDLSIYELSGEYDIRPLVLETLLTYLELAGVVESRGHFYREYQFEPLKSSKEILSRFNEQRADFLGKIFRHAKKGTRWFSINVGEAAAQLNEKRERIVAALSYLEDQGDLVLKYSGVHRAFRRNALPAQEREQLSQTLTTKFQKREQNDLDRLQNVIAFAQLSDCAWKHLLDYFGDGSISECGHCSRCHGEPATALPADAEPLLGAGEERLLIDLCADNHEALSSPRQLARFLCGITSPAVSRARLGRDPRFGRLAEYSFRRVLEWVISIMASQK